MAGSRRVSVMTAVKVGLGGNVRASRGSSNLTDPEQEAREMDLSLRRTQPPVAARQNQPKERTADRGRGSGSKFRKDGTQE